MAFGECSAYSSLLTNPKVKFAASATSWWLSLTDIHIGELSHRFFHRR